MAKEAKRRRGRPSEFDGKRFKKVAETTRKQGSHGHKNWLILQDGMTYDEFKAAGGNRKYLAWEIAKGHVKVIEQE